MAFQARFVQPGDPIASDWWNELTSALVALEGRVATLERGAVSGGLAPVVSSRDPLGDVEVGSRLTLLGHNFLQPAEQNTVTLGSATISQFLAGSDDEHLIFQIPDVFSGLPQTLPLVVRNRNGSSVAISVRVLEHEQAQGGWVVFFPRTASGQTPQPGQQLDFEWDVDSQTTVPEHYVLSAVFSNAVGASAGAWSQAATVTPSGSQRIARGQPLRATLSVVVPNGAQSVDVALRATAQEHPQLTRTSDAQHVEVGQQVTPSDSRTTMSRRPVTPLDDTGNPNPAREATINGASGVEVQFGRKGYLLVDAHFSVQGRYKFSAEVESAAGNWTAQVEPSTANRNAGSQSQLAAHVGNQETAPGAGPRFMIVRAAKRNAADTADDFVSYVRFPVRGYTP